MPKRRGKTEVVRPVYRQGNTMVQHVQPRVGTTTVEDPVPPLPPGWPSEDDWIQAGLIASEQLKGHVGERDSVKGLPLPPAKTPAVMTPQGLYLGETAQPPEPIDPYGPPMDNEEPIPVEDLPLEGGADEAAKRLRELLATGYVPRVAPLGTRVGR